MNTLPHSKRVIIIFGGGGYVGGATADLFEQSGWTVLRASRHAGSEAGHLTCDITDNASVTEAFEVAARTYGRVDACLHAASPQLERVPFLAASPESFSAHIQTAIIGTMNIVGCATKATMSNIVVITSQATDASRSKMGAYPFAKRIQEELCATLALALPTQVLLHTVAPGFLPGGLNMDLPQSMREAFAKNDEGTGADADTIAHIILDICEEKPEYRTSASIDGITGAVTPF